MKRYKLPPRLFTLGGMCAWAAFFSGSVGLLVSSHNFQLRNGFAYGYWTPFFSQTAQQLPWAAVFGAIIVLPGLLIGRRIYSFSHSAKKAATAIGVWVVTWMILQLVAEYWFSFLLDYTPFHNGKIAFFLQTLVLPEIVNGSGGMRWGMIGGLLCFQAVTGLLGFYLGERLVSRISSKGQMHEASRLFPYVLATIGYLALAALLVVPYSLGQMRSGTNRKNLILISIDTLRPDHMSLYGYNRNTTPNLDRLSEHGLVFTDAFSASGWTLPSHATMLTGKSPLSHGAINYHTAIDNRTMLLSEVLQANGYRTYGIVSSLFLSRRYHFSRGFDSYDYYIDGKNAGALTDLAVKRLRDGQKPFFFFFHIFDPHWPYEPPMDYRIFGEPKNIVIRDNKKFMNFLQWILKIPANKQREVVDLYDGEIYYTDSQLGRFFQFLEESGLRNDTVIVIVSDHGEEFAEHGWWGHGHSLYQELLRVPLMIVLPDSEQLPPRHIDETVGLIDLMPTLCELLKVELPFAVEGHSFACLLRNDCPEPRTKVYLAHNINNVKTGQQIYALRDAQNKYISASADRKLHELTLPYPEQLFDLANDPHETINLIEQNAALAKRLIDQLAIMQPSQPVGDSNEIGLAPNQRNQIQSLGYINR